VADAKDLDAVYALEARTTTASAKRPAI